MKGTNIGEFEELVLLTIGALHPEAYGVAIKNEIKQLAGRSVTLSTVHASLNRLQDKGMIKSEMGEATSKRGGKRKKFFSITAFGAKTLADVREQREAIWQMIPDAALPLKINHA
ncbi:PadR family transcriptional regulator [Roseivirga sp.]|uniref:PadR family transcriptional regulator n=1 Tax=Roseivirga sp. TaxID=1964215 RepID=UPI003B515A7C